MQFCMTLRMRTAIKIKLASRKPPVGCISPLNLPRPHTEQRWRKKKTSRPGREFGGAHAATELRAAQDAHGQRPNPRNVERVNVSLEQIQDDGLWKW